MTSEMLQKRIDQTQILMMDINRVREQCNALLRELSIDQALINVYAVAPKEQTNDLGQ